ncbi:MAG TPA: hypothetical protein VEF89_19335 [Solirubrobacteraceae bacterium]|nr:hypothetical protein [Solirubrobacteraceae bacterium]
MVEHPGSGEGVARDGRHHQIERVLGASPVSGRVGRGPIASSISIIEPGQPWVRINGSAFSCGDSTWMKWTSSPSISVLNWGSAFSLASHLCQS